MSRSILGVGSAATVDLSRYPHRPTRSTLDFNDPILVKQALGVEELKEKLFPVISTGATVWPYILVARDLGETCDQKKIKATLNRIYRKLFKTTGVSRVGPLATSTFNIYRRMYREIDKCDPLLINQKWGPKLRAFINDGRIRFDGELKVLAHHSQKWKKLLMHTCGKPGVQFARLLRIYQFKNSDLNAVEYAVDEIIRAPGKFDPLLYRAAFAYAFLRCIYGPGGSNIEAHIKAEDWVRHLLSGITRLPVNDKMRSFTKYLDQCRESPVWHHVAQDKRNQGRIVLASLKFRTFYTLYINSIPIRLQRYVK
jgi:hypothetical protein